MTGPGLFDIDGKVALVTGGSRGIGKMIAAGYVEAGASVYLASRKREACEEAAAELSERGRCVGLGADLSTEEGCRALADEMARREDRLDILVNNSGATWGAPLDEYDEAAWERVLALNVKGVFHLTKFCVPLLQAAGTAEEPARVINIGSIDGIHVPVLETYAYSSAKAAVHQLTRHLARRLAPEITVNAIAPGPFESKMMAATLEAFGEQIAAAAPLRRIGRPDDMAGAAIYLASRAGAYVTGVILPVDGGIATDRVSATARLGEDDGAVAVQKDAVFQVPTKAPGEHRAFDVPADAHQLVGVVGVVDPPRVLLDDRAVVEVRRDVVARGADELHAPLEGLVVGACPGERREERVVDVHDPARVALTQLRRDDLHVAGEHHDVAGGLVELAPHLREGARSFSASACGPAGIDTWWNAMPCHSTTSRNVSWLEITQGMSQTRSPLRQR